MRRILALLAERPAGDYRAVFSEFAERLERMLRRRAAHPRARIRALPS